MKTPTRPDLSSAYGDCDDTLSWPRFVLVVAYSLTLGWITIVARCVWLYVTSLGLRHTHFKSRIARQHLLPRSYLRHNH
jgi:hypothetical protein